MLTQSRDISLKDPALQVAVNDKKIIISLLTGNEILHLYAHS